MSKSMGRFILISLSANPANLGSSPRQCSSMKLKYWLIAASLLVLSIFIPIRIAQGADMISNIKGLQVDPKLSRRAQIRFVTLAAL